MSIFGAPFHSSYSRASVDALSNFIEFPEFNFEQDAHALLQSKLDSDRIPLFLHEATHHWCFDSPVFYTLFILQVRALGGLWKIANRGKPDEFDIIDDIYRYRAVVDLYRPILEGLALFAEHVALPRGETNYSHPFTQMYMLSRGLLGEKENVRRASNALLAAARASSDLTRKKAGLLSMPLGASRSPYLTGYMLVCSIWRAMLNHHVDLFVNTDAVLSYLRSYFLFDYELIAILMNNQIHEGLIVDTIAQHLMRRMLRLFNPDLSILVALNDAKNESNFEAISKKYSIATLKSAISDWERNEPVAINPQHLLMRTKSNWFRKVGISGLDGVFKPIKGILNDEGKAVQTQEQLIRAFDWLLPTNEGQDLAAIKQFAFAQLHERTKLIMLQTPVQATIEDGKCTITLPTGKLKLDSARGTLPGIYDARLELFLSSRIVNPLAYVWANGKVVGVFLPHELERKLDLEAIGSMHEGDKFRKIVQFLNEISEKDEAITDSYVRILIDSYEKTIANAIDHAYDTVFMGLFGETTWAAARDEMREHGLLGLTNASFAAVRGLASLSQLSCFPISEVGWNKLVSNIRADGDLPDPVDEAMRFFGPDSRMPLMARINTHWLVWV
jgi:hypothetical protein